MVAGTRKEDCREPKQLSNVTIDVTNGTTYGSFASIKCSPGYTLHGDNIKECLSNGSWSAFSTNCTLNVCPNVTAPANGSVNTSKKSVAVYSCIRGFEIIGSNTLVCNLNGSWDSLPPTCKIKDCGQMIYDPLNGKVHLNGNATTYNATATFMCNNGYQLNGESLSRCNASGKWKRNSYCGNLTDPSNGKADMSDGTTYLSVGKYSCNTGYTIYGNNSTTCTENGNWSDHYVKCIINGNIATNQTGQAMVQSTKQTEQHMAL
ncbi:E-selectin-like [Mercenaria mercenaria]|uniref:E-selectin-like n=1 Tax=Mercenaria mercenaria TaxID=6596 RepID=UPI00234EC23F|nr:E-selectin-like [Mercenaria mercenaria]